MKGVCLILFRSVVHVLLTSRISAVHACLAGHNEMQVQKGEQVANNAGWCVLGGWEYQC